MNKFLKQNRKVNFGMPKILYLTRCLFYILINIPFKPIVPMAALCYSSPIAMKFKMRIEYTEKLQCNKFGQIGR